MLISLSSILITPPGLHSSVPQRSGPKQEGYQNEQSVNPVWTIFDLGHGEIYSPEKTGPLHYSSLFERFKAAGERVSVSDGYISAKTLDNVRTYIFTGPSREFEKSEIEILKNFVKKGGNLLVLTRLSLPVTGLTEQFGIKVSEFVVAEASGNIDRRPHDFYVTRFNPHTVTSGLDRIALYGCWALSVKGDAKVVAETSASAWADLNLNGRVDSGEVQGPFGVVAVSSYGKGKVAVIANDAPFANKFIDEAGNKRLADNIVKWFRE